MQNTVPENWYESFFSGINCDMGERAMPEEVNASEAAFLMDVLKIKNRSEILDIPCGFERLAIPLARKGFRLSGVDISEQFITILDKKVAEEKLPVRTIHGNVLTMDLTGSFDGVDKTDYKLQIRRSADVYCL